MNKIRTSVASSRPAGTASALPSLWRPAAAASSGRHTRYRRSPGPARVRALVLRVLLREGAIEDLV